MIIVQVLLLLMLTSLSDTLQLDRRRVVQVTRRLVRLPPCQDGRLEALSVYLRAGVGFADLRKTSAHHERTCVHASLIHLSVRLLLLLLCHLNIRLEHHELLNVIAVVLDAEAFGLQRSQLLPPDQL